MPNRTFIVGSVATKNSKTGKVSQPGETVHLPHLTDAEAEMLVERHVLLAPPKPPKPPRVKPVKKTPRRAAKEKKLDD